MHKCGWRYFPRPFPKDQSAVGQVVVSPHLVITLVQSGRKCVCMCHLLRHVHIASHINVTWQSAGLVANRMLDGGDRAPEKVIYIEVELDCKLESFQLAIR